MPANRGKAHYAAFFPQEKRTTSFFRLAVLDLPDGMMPQPTLDLGVSGARGGIRFTHYDGTQAGLGRAFGFSQRTASNYLRNPDQPDAVREAAHLLGPAPSWSEAFFNGVDRQ